MIQAAISLITRGNLCCLVQWKTLEINRFIPRSIIKKTIFVIPLFSLPDSDFQGLNLRTDLPEWDRFPFRHMRINTYLPMLYVPLFFLLWRIAKKNYKSWIIIYKEIVSQFLKLQKCIWLVKNFQWEDPLLCAHLNDTKTIWNLPLQHAYTLKPSKKRNFDKTRRLIKIAALALRSYFQPEQLINVFELQLKFTL